MKKVPIELKGIYKRGEIYWLAFPMVNGSRHQPMSLETTDLQTAIRSAEIARGSPLVAPSDPLLAEIDRFLTTPFEDKKCYSQSSRRALRNTLRAFVKQLPNRTHLGGVTTAMVQA